MNPSAATPSPGPGKALIARVAVALALLLAIALAYHHREALHPAQLESWVRGWGAAGMGVFVLLYAMATVLFLPGSLLTLAGGALFGPWLGGVLSLTGATLGAGVAFLIARYLAGDWVVRRAGGMTRQLLAGVEEEGWRFVAFVRVVPLFPFNLLNYALGLTRLPFGHYLLASFVCMAPGGLAYAWLGHAGRSAATGEEDAVRIGLWALAILAVALLIPRWVKHWRETERHLTPARLRERLAAGDGLVVLDLRDEKDFVGENGHVPGARNLPLPELTERLEEVRALGRPVAVMCHTDRRSREAFAKLDAAGIHPLYLVTGGIKQWREESFPVER